MTLVRVVAVPVHPLSCSVHISFRSVRSSDAYPDGFQDVWDSALHKLECDIPNEPAQGFSDRDRPWNTRRLPQRHERRPAQPRS